MKRIIPILLLLLLLAGCKGLYPDEYISVEEHEAPFAYKSITELPEQVREIFGP